jgi:hypothetical protein
MLIGGMHGFDQSLSYIIQMKLPRSYMGSQGNKLVDDLVLSASNRGIPVKTGETVSLNLKMGGTISSPTLQTELREAAGDAAKELKAQAADFVKQKTDSAKQVVKDSAQAIKKQVTQDLAAGLKNQFISKDSGKAFNLDSSRKKTGEALKNTFGRLIKKKG